MLHSLITVWFNFLKDSSYLGVIILMAMESSIFPVPSEVVMPPAGYWAAQGHMNFWGVVAAGTFGSWLGSAITYAFSLWLGRLVIVRWGKYFFISEHKLERAEMFMHRYEAGGVFFSRLLPVMRHLISIPAGIVKMNFWVFSVVTTVGAFIWCTILTWLGADMARKHPEMINDPTEMVHAIKSESIPIVVFVVVLLALYVVTMRMTAPKKAAAVPAADAPPAAE